VDGRIEEDWECPEEVVNVPYGMRLFGRKINQSQSLSKKCKILSNFVSEDFIECNVRVDSELCITRAGKFGLMKKFDINQRKKVQRHRFGRIREAILQKIPFFL